MDYLEIAQNQATKHVIPPQHQAPSQTWKSRISVICLLLLWQISQLASLIPIINQKYKLFHWPVALFVIIFSATVILTYLWARKYQLIPKISWRYFPVGKIALGLGFVFVAALISGFIMTLSGHATTDNQAAMNDLGSSLPPIVFIALTTSAGFFEELIFRVSPFELLFNQWPKIAALAAWGLFTLAHDPTNLPSFITYASMSLVLTAFYFKYRNFYLNMAIHLLWNTFVIIVFYATLA
ncbi:MAG: CPBP family intramembrane metalloprotease [Streptococcaceae bacterium]|jgi:membrane protease YdiL (CAAX protease family)|nr:CPBP family intramembrane metalloprotease [Streptococcaceae bacterium]